jgi:hypothetical protein
MFCDGGIFKKKKDKLSELPNSLKMAKTSKMTKIPKIYVANFATNSRTVKKSSGLLCARMRQFVQGEIVVFRNLRGCFDS